MLLAVASQMLMVTPPAPCVQVSHHPPICAAHAENGQFVYDIVSAPTTRFLGNSLEVYPYGRPMSR